MTTSGSTSTAAARAWAIRRQRVRRLARSLVMFVGVPTLIAIVYYGVIAADEYESTAVVTVQSAASGGGSELADLAARFGSGPEVGAAKDSELLGEVIRARAMLDFMAAEHQILEHYRSGGDWLGRLGAEAGSEEAYDFYRERVNVAAPTAAGTMSVTVRAFAPEDAQAFNQAILARAEQRLNELVSHAHVEVLAEASALVKAASARVASARAQVASARKAAEAGEADAGDAAAAEAAYEDAHAAAAAAHEALTVATLAEHQSARHLVFVSSPSLPTEATYPKRAWGIARVFFVALSLAGVFGLLLGAVREHAKF